MLPVQRLEFKGQVTGEVDGRNQLRVESRQKHIPIHRGIGTEVSVFKKIFIFSCKIILVFQCFFSNIFYYDLTHLKREKYL